MTDPQYVKPDPAAGAGAGQPRDPAPPPTSSDITFAEIPSVLDKPAGVVGKHKFTYDIWGNTVNTAQRVEAAGDPGRISIGELTWQHINARFDTEARGAVEVKHQGLVNMYYLNRIKPDFAADPAGVTPNERFWKQE